MINFLKNVFKIIEYKTRKDELSDWICWCTLVGPGVILNKDGSFQKTYAYRGHDLDSATKEEMMVKVAQLNNVLRRLPGEWALYIEASRKKSSGYTQKNYPDIITAMIDAERQEYFSSGIHYESVYYFTLQYLPPEDKYDKFEKLFINRQEVEVNKERDRVYEHLKNFMVEVNRVYYLLKEIMAECRELNDDETITYLHSCISNKDQKLKTPEIPTMLDAILYDTPLIGGLDPALGDSHHKEYLGIVSVFGFPPMTLPGILDELNRLHYEYRWVTRYLPMDKLDASSFFAKLRREWFSKRKTMMTMLKENLFKSESAMVEEAAVEKYNDAQTAIAELENDYVNFGFFKTTVVVKHENKKILYDIVRSIEKAIDSRGFTSKLEDYNAVSAWLGTLPGMARDDVRKPIVNSLNLAHMFPISAVWAGDRWNKHLNAPPLMQTQTTGSTPFRFNLHVGDVGNTMIVGPIGSGKSVLLNTIEAQYRGYENSQIYIFDKGGSSRVLTAGVGGDFYDLASEGNGISFQPLANIDEENERIWANEWLHMIYGQAEVKLTPEDKKDIWNALQTMAKTSPREQRTLGAFFLTLQSKKLKSVLEQYIKPIEHVTNGGPYGKLFDANNDNLTYGRWQAFEMGELMNKKLAVMPTLQYLFHVIEKRCDGSPTLIVLDECWVFLDNPLFAEKIREWFKTMRKNNVAIIFATQNLQDVATSSIAPAIIESCFTRIFLPNPTAMNVNDAPVYKMFDINDKERQIIATAIQKRQYYYKSRKGSRLFELALSNFALSYVASASKEDQAKCRQLLQDYPRQQFNDEWLKYKGQKDALEIYKDIIKEGLYEVG